MKNKIITLVIAIATLSFNITACSTKSETISDYSTHKIAYIEQESIVTYLYKDNSDNIVYEVDNENNILNKYTTSVDDDVGQNKEILELSDTTEYSDISNSLEHLGDYIYYMGIEQSTKYINFMKESGYKVKFKINTPEFVEMVLTDDTGTRRVIITEEYMIIAKVDGYTFKIKNYI